MSARSEYGPLSWEEAEQNRRQSLGENLIEIQDGIFLRNIEQPAGAHPLREDLATVGPQPPRSALLKQGDRLRNEINRGREYLEQIQKELAESRALLETWPAYERQCGRNPLPHLTRLVSVNERIERFLPGWLTRQEEKLAALTKEMELPAQQNGLEYPGAEDAARALPRILA